jgi:hypothetical protein
MKYIHDMIDRKICCFPLLASRHIAASLVTASKLSGVGAEVIVYAVTRSILEYCCIDFTKDDILNIIPCKKTMEGWIQELAVSILFVGSVRLDEEEGIGTYLATDKAEEKMKKGMTKIIFKFSPSLATTEFPDGQEYSCILDSDKTGDTTEEGAKGCVNSICKLPNHSVLKFWGFIADSRGGFTCEQKKAALMAEGFCRMWALMASCTCHDVQLTGTVPMRHLFEKGLVGIRSLLQLLFLGNEFQTVVLERQAARELLDESKELHEIALDEDKLAE